MRRTQLYLDDELWNALHVQARRQKTTISELVRSAARERYLPGTKERRKAMQAIVGMWKDRPEFEDPEAYLRALRRGIRLDHITGS